MHIDKESSSYSQGLDSEVMAASFLKLKLTMTISAEPQKEANAIPLQKFLNTTVQCKKIISNNKCLLNDSKYSDFTFIVKEKQFKVHKCVLAHASPVFDKIFSAQLKESRTNECHVAQIEPAVFQYLLSFIYAAELPDNLHEGNISRLLFSAAHYYEIDELVHICTQVEHFKLTVANAEDMYGWAYTYQLEDIMMDAWKIIKW